MNDPRDQYPRPPFDVIDGKPSPSPDHGEESYVGRGRLEGRKVLLTGGNSGIGRAAAIAFAREGADVAFTFHSDEEGAEGTVEQIEKAGRVALSLKLDASSEQECVDVVNEAASKLGGLDTLVMVAGYQNNIDDILDLETDQLTKTYAANVFSLFWLTKAALEYIPAGGSIITTSSIQATQPSPDKVDYASTKAAIINFTEGMAQQLAPKGIRVNTVAPGPFWTNLQPDAGNPDELTNFGADTPYERPGQPAECAGAYVYLASDDASYTSGATILIAGGKIA
ncbi:SDR family oxidoreductase [Marisediminicola senii]|uniref:SDR family oxidoreductase n=1 Tax=Marisediminicola senii TaxID=2711233 RepID=UPI0013EA68DA|nr:SDR family oxidoreductase [Marisediminicola senii]